MIFTPEEKDQRDTLTAYMMSLDIDFANFYGEKTENIMKDMDLAFQNIGEDGNKEDLMKDIEKILRKHELLPKE